MQIKTYLSIDGGPTFENAISCEKNMLFAVVVPEGIDIRVERAFTLQHEDNQVLLDTSVLNHEPNIAVDCGAGVGDLGRIGGVGERKDKGAREGERAEPQLADMEFPIQGGNTWKAGTQLVQDLTAAYGHSGVHRCMTRALAWLRCNPDKLKTSRGMPKFLNRWLANENRPIQASSNTLTKDVTTTAKIVKGRPTVQGW